uniref:Uncharacterized protein n=1 Tax=Seriola lalandi dorsalis TaxID=1841481 RepID=A0A3B4WXA8_SERLL
MAMGRRVGELLLRHGAEINLQDSIGITALISAASNGHERVVELLIRRGAEINLQSSDGVTALMPVKAEPCFTASREFQRAEAMAHVQQARVHAYERAIRDSGDGSVPGGLGGGAAGTHS